MQWTHLEDPFSKAL